MRLSLLTIKCEGETNASGSPPPLLNERQALDTPELADTQLLFLSDGCPHEPHTTVRLRRLYSLSPHVLWAACRGRQWTEQLRLRMVMDHIMETKSGCSPLILALWFTVRGLHINKPNLQPLTKVYCVNKQDDVQSGCHIIHLIDLRKCVNLHFQLHLQVQFLTILLKMLKL